MQQYFYILPVASISGGVVIILKKMKKERGEERRLHGVVTGSNDLLEPSNLKISIALQIILCVLILQLFAIFRINTLGHDNLQNLHKKLLLEVLMPL